MCHKTLRTISRGWVKEMDDVLVEIHNNYERAKEDVRKATVLIKSMDSKQSAADRFLKLARRLYDIYKLFEEEFPDSIDVVAAKAMLVFARACFIVSHVLLKADWLKLRDSPSLSSRMSSLPKRAAHKVIKRTVKKVQYQFHCEEEDYVKAGFGYLFVGSSKSKRKYADELTNTAISLKDHARRLCAMGISSGLIDDTKSFKDLDATPPNVAEFDLNDALKDLTASQDILKQYYEVVTEKVESVQRMIDNKEINPDEVDYDECLVPLLETLGMAGRTTLRGYMRDRGKKAKMLDMHNSEGDILDVTRFIAFLDTCTD